LFPILSKEKKAFDGIPQGFNRGPSQLNRHKNNSNHGNGVRVCRQGNICRGYIVYIVEVKFLLKKETRGRRSLTFK